MEKQNYKNHIRYYTAHHFVFYPLMLLLLGACIYGIIRSQEQQLLWFVITGLVVITGWLSYMVRQHYSLTNQNRIARLELRLRYYQLTHKRLELIEEQLTLSHILALRFASDEELEALVQKAIAEKLSPDAIKQSIKTWVGDYMRV